MLGDVFTDVSLPLCLLQAQHSHHVIQQVLNHLDTNNRNTPRVRAGIVQVLLETVAIAAKGSVGEFPRGETTESSCGCVNPGLDARRAPGAEQELRSLVYLINVCCK